MTSITKSADPLPQRQSFFQKNFNHWAWLILPIFVFLAVFFVYPLFEILQRSITEPELGLGNFITFYQ